MSPARGERSSPRQRDAPAHSGRPPDGCGPSACRPRFGGMLDLGGGFGAAVGWGGGWGWVGAGGGGVGWGGGAAPVGWWPPPPQPMTAKAVSGIAAAVARRVMGLLRGT